MLFMFPLLSVVEHIVDPSWCSGWRFGSGWGVGFHIRWLVLCSDCFVTWFLALLGFWRWMLLTVVFCLDTRALLLVPSSTITLMYRPTGVYPLFGFSSTCCCWTSSCSGIFFWASLLSRMRVQIGSRLGRNSVWTFGQCPICLAPSNCRHQGGLMCPMSHSGGTWRPTAFKRCRCLMAARGSTRAVDWDHVFDFIRIKTPIMYDLHFLSRSFAVATSLGVNSCR